jgi:hypothetical protein
MMDAETPMPVFGLIARILARIALLGAVAAMRRRAGGAPPPWRTPPTGPTGPVPRPPGGATASIDPDRARRALRLVGEGVSIGVRVVLVAGFLAAFTLLLTAGTTATTLGPRWLGACLLVLAAIALVLALAELRVAWRLRLAQVRRKRAERLRLQER